MLLKSWAMPPASVPMDSIFCACWSWVSSMRFSSSVSFRLVTSRSIPLNPAGFPSLSISNEIDSSSTALLPFLRITSYSGTSSGLPVCLTCSVMREIFSAVSGVVYSRVFMPNNWLRGYPKILQNGSLENVKFPFRSVSK